MFVCLFYKESGINVHALLNLSNELRKTEKINKLFFTTKLINAIIIAKMSSQKYCKDQESIQSSTTTDAGYHMGKQQKHN